MGRAHNLTCHPKPTIIDSNEGCAAGVQDDSAGLVGRPHLRHSGRSGNLPDGALLPEADRRLPGNHGSRLGVPAMPGYRLPGSAQSVCSNRELSRLSGYKVSLCSGSVTNLSLMSTCFHSSLMQKPYEACCRGRH